MRLLLVRHGSAAMHHDDDARQLSELGQLEAQRIAGWIKQLRFNQPTIWHSDKVRAKETAAIIREGCGWDNELIEIEGIRPNSPIEPIATRIAAEDHDLVIVGHMPFMPALASELVTNGCTETYWNFETGAALCLERSGMGQWVVCGFSMPSQLPLNIP